MGFYEDLSQHYAAIFALDPEEAAFLQLRVAGCANVLDIGCAIGGKSVLCAGVATQVTGVDNDESMIALARQKNARANIHYVQAGMLDLSLVAKEAHYDCVLCMGNTLLHLATEEEICDALAQMHLVLAEKGRLLIQILNYDRIIDKKITTLPEIKTPGASLRRSYDWSGGKLLFRTVLQDTRSGQEFHNTIPLLPLRTGALLCLLEKVGFYRCTVFGSFDESPYTEDSFLTVVEAKK